MSRGSAVGANYPYHHRGTDSTSLLRREHLRPQCDMTTAVSSDISLGGKRTIKKKKRHRKKPAPGGGGGGEFIHP